MIHDWLTLVGATFGALLPITNPFSTAPVFVSLTHRMSKARRRQQARMACIYTFAVLTVSLVAGALILAFFGISIHALRVAGGLIVARVGFGMLNPHPEEEIDDQSISEAMDSRDVAFTPVAMPMLSGPGAIAVTIGMATQVEHVIDHVPIIAGIALVSLTAFLVLRSADRVVDFMGVTGVTALTRIMGLLLVGIGVQFVFIGVFQPLVSDPVIGAILDAIQRNSPK